MLLPARLRGAEYYMSVCGDGFVLVTAVVASEKGCLGKGH